MDPFTLAVFTIAAGFATGYGSVGQLANVVSGEPREPELDEFYPQSAEGTVEIYSNRHLYQGRKVLWPGTPGQMVRVYPEYMRNIEGNIFTPAKLKAVAKAVHEAQDPIVFHPPYGTMQKINRTVIEESIQYEDDNPLSTGDEEADEYLKDPSEFGTEEQREMEALIAELEEEKSGDFGAWIATIRDGNHRAFGAIIGGEPFIWMKLSANEMQDVEEVLAGRSTLHESSQDEVRELASMLE